MSYFKTPNLGWTKQNFFGWTKQNFTQKYVELYILEITELSNPCKRTNWFVFLLLIIVDSNPHKMGRSLFGQKLFKKIYCDDSQKM